MIDNFFAYFMLFMFCLGFIMTGVVITRFIHQLIIFERRDKNPCRRYCRRCGQCQEVYTYWIEGYNDDWWEDMGPIYDEDCACHSYSEYRSLL